jgi:hypothetical protein
MTKLLRNHAEIYCEANSLVIYDLKSLNGTNVNRTRILKPTKLNSEDQIRIGQCTVIVSRRSNDKSLSLTEALSGTHPLTRELLLESIDKHAVLLFEVSSRLSSVIDLEPALQEISSLMKAYMGADKCEVIMAEDFDRFAELGFPASIAPAYRRSELQYSLQILLTRKPTDSAIL